jgi:hypothetical protein
MTYALTGEFTVKDARNRGNIPNPHGGELTRWYVDFLDANGEPVKNEKGEAKDCYWQRKPEYEVKADDTVYGTISEGQYGLRFKKEQKPDGAPSSGSEARTGTGGGQGKNWQPESERDPERSARILRQHSQEMALRFLSWAAVANLHPVDALAAIGIDAPEQTLGQIKALADFFDADVNQAGQAARGGQLPSPTTAGESQTAASPSQPADEEKRDIEMAIDSASAENLGVEARSLVADYMLSELDEAERTRACNQLTNSQDPQAQGMTIRAMKARTEKWSGAPLPVGDTGGTDDVPF